MYEFILHKAGYSIEIGLVVLGKNMCLQDTQM